MPNYDYECKSCGLVWEEQQKIADRDIPTESPCPDCGASTIERVLLSAPVFGREQGKTPEAFKDVLRNIKSKYRGARIDNV